ncbi:hypothetical protein K437DRAFT_272398 [Tilletiaria anomala UBC 951]|uniref:Uncharacterized protein n=1 Tax=Tilletiaria anomala (strain ATCC 24038 / CBS 436.72 / UBC 951) TaxID=1037660 RepID=A0A066WEZ6_TILAU|nr:uncharacterized protein K437DRAFT_272398 [Tilletiaria anomala UBC 951]KDN52532.1 hypothetical protein K437DRAFT_272398 [Tilletiaria anomala UBC 951]
MSSYGSAQAQQAQTQTQLHWWFIPLAAIPVLFILTSFTPFFGSSKSSRRNKITRQAYDPRTGIGRGAPGFQTNVAKVAIPPDIAARIRAGEDVSAEEITQALEDVKAGRYKPKEQIEKEEWLPAGVTGGTVPSKGGRKGKRR